MGCSIYCIVYTLPNSILVIFCVYFLLQFVRVGQCIVDCLLAGVEHTHHTPYQDYLKYVVVCVLYILHILSVCFMQGV